MSVWDPLRNYAGGVGSYASDREKSNVRGVDQWPAYVFSESEVWDGLWEESQARRVPVCNGLLFDWSSWIKDRDQSNADAMQAALEALSPAGGDTLSAGPVQRLSIQDSRDIPTIRTAYAGAVPILHASADVRRVCALAYVLTWAWIEHRLAAKHFGREATDSVVMLFDEVESHLHPRWQRTILSSLRNLGSALLRSAASGVARRGRVLGALERLRRTVRRHAVIPVRPAPEPPDFDRTVRQPGLRAIAELVGEPPQRHAGKAFDQVADSRDIIPAAAMNSYKGEYEDVLDPFELQDGRFALELVASGRAGHGTCR